MVQKHQRQTSFMNIQDCLCNFFYSFLFWIIVLSKLFLSFVSVPQFTSHLPLELFFSKMQISSQSHCLKSFNKSFLLSEQQTPKLLRWMMSQSLPVSASCEITLWLSKEVCFPLSPKAVFLHLSPRLKRHFFEENFLTKPSWTVFNNAFIIALYLLVCLYPYTVNLEGWPLS